LKTKLLQLIQKFDDRSLNLSENYIKTGDGEDFCEFTDEWIGVQQGVEECANALREVLGLPIRKYWEERVDTAFSNR